MAYRHVVRSPRLQARIFLPEWFMHVVKPAKQLPSNVAKFRIPMEMSRLDVKNYLTSIYNINVAKVNIQIQSGKTQRVMMKDGAVKDKKYPDVKMAYVTMADDTFKYPELFVKSQKREEAEKEMKERKPDDFKWF